MVGAEERLLMDGDATVVVAAVALVVVAGIAVVDVEGNFNKLVSNGDVPGFTLVLVLAAAV